MKRHTFVKYIQTICHAQEPKLLHVYFSNYSPCSMTKCLFFKKTFYSLKRRDICSFVEKQFLLLFVLIKVNRSIQKAAPVPLKISFYTDRDANLNFFNFGKY